MHQGHNSDTEFLKNLRKRARASRSLLDCAFVVPLRRALFRRGRDPQRTRLWLPPLGLSQYVPLYGAPIGRILPGGDFDGESAKADGNYGTDFLPRQTSAGQVLELLPATPASGEWDVFRTVVFWFIRESDTVEGGNQP